MIHFINPNFYKHLVEVVEKVMRSFQGQAKQTTKSCIPNLVKASNYHQKMYLSMKSKSICKLYIKYMIFFNIIQYYWVYITYALTCIQIFKVVADQGGAHFNHLLTCINNFLEKVREP